MNRPKPEKTPVNRELPTELVEQIKRIAEIEERSFTVVYTRLLEIGVAEYLNRHPELKAKLEAEQNA